jgi:NADH-quinone oxidoreductase subunit M
VAALGVILAAVYLLWMVQRVAFGSPAGQMAAHLRDLNLREMAILSPLVVMVFWIGFFPNPILTPMHASVNHLIQHVDERLMNSAERRMPHDEGESKLARSDIQRSAFSTRHSE